MQAWVVRSCDVFGLGRLTKQDGVPIGATLVAAPYTIPLSRAALAIC